jgi:hypothetical protein
MLPAQVLTLVKGSDDEIEGDMTTIGSRRDPEVDPGDLCAGLTDHYAAPLYRRSDTRATAEQRRACGELLPDDVNATELGGDQIRDGRRMRALRRELRGRAAPGVHSRAGAVLLERALVLA